MEELLLLVGSNRVEEFVVLEAMCLWVEILALVWE